MGANKKPDSQTNWASSGTYVNEPTPGKKADGFIEGERVGAQHFNWPLNNLSQFESYSASLPSGLLPAGVYEGMKVYYGGAAGVFSVYGDTFAVSSVSTPSKYFQVANQKQRFFNVGQQFIIDGSTGNDGTYTITAVDNVLGLSTRLTVSEAIPSAVADGDIYLGGTILTHEGVRLSELPQLQFNVGAPASAPGAGTPRVDYCVGSYDTTSNALTLRIEEGATTGILDNEYIFAKIDSNGAAYTVELITQSERILESRNTIVIGDGQNSFDSESLEEPGRIQDAIDKVSKLGGGNVVIAGDNHRLETTDIELRSNVAIVGSGKSRLRLGDSTSILMNGVQAATGTITGVILVIGGPVYSYITDATKDFWDYGIGSQVVISGSGAGNDGTYYIVDINESGDRAYLANSSYGENSMTNEAAGFTYTVNIHKAGIRDVQVAQDGTTDTECLDISYTSHCYIRDTLLVNDVSGVLKANAIAVNNDNSSFSVLGNIVGPSFTNSINTVVAGSNENWVIDSNKLTGSISLTSTGSGFGSFGINKFSILATITIPANYNAGTIFPSEIRMKDSEKFIQGTGQDSEIYDDGSNQIFEADKQSAGGRTHVFTEPIVGAKDISPGADGAGATAAPGVTEGFIYEATLTGAPVGVPSGSVSRVPSVVVPSVTSEYFYYGAAWHRLPIEPVYGRFQLNAPAVLAPPNGVLTIVDYDASVIEGPGASRVTTGAAWKMTADRDMVLRVSAYLRFLSVATWAAGDDATLSLYKNGVLYAQLASYEVNSSLATNTVSLGGACVVSLVATDFIDVRVTQNNAAGGAIALNPAYPVGIDWGEI